MKNIEWHRTAGVELTRLRPWEFDETVPPHIKATADKYFPHDKYDNRRYIISQFREPAEAHYEAVREALLPKFERDNMHILNAFGYDPGCVEVSSAILTGWDQLNEFYHKVDGLCEDLGLIRWVEEQCGSGGHVHIGIKDSSEAQKVRQLMLNHPEAMFAFCSPSDSYHGLLNTRQKSSDVYTSSQAESMKAGPIAYRRCYETVEFRMFDIAQTWEMQEEHMAFAQSFVEHAIKNPVARRDLISSNEVNSRKVKDHNRNFENLIRMLKLPWRRYSRYVEIIELRDKFKTSNYGKM